MASDISLIDLKNELTAMRAGFDGWANARLHALETTQKRYSEGLEDAHGKARMLRREEDEHKEAAANLQRVLDKQQEVLDKLSRELKALEAEESSWPPQIADLQELVRQESQHNEEEMAEVEDTEKVKRKKADALLSALGMYRKHLGLQFEHSAKDRLRLVFVNIDPLDPAREFSFVLHVTTNSSEYSVIECTPQISDMQALVAEVNSTNDFSGFVRSVRRKFRSLVQAVDGN
eukprot:jgi/Mesen1/7366/ME000381S06596